jgi:hypothetical protein
LLDLQRSRHAEAEAERFPGNAEAKKNAYGDLGTESVAFVVYRVD